ESARAVRQEGAEVEWALRQAAAERDRALAQAQAEAAREGQPEKLRQQQTAIWEQYEEKRYEILTQCEDKREQGLGARGTLGRWGQDGGGWTTPRRRLRRVPRSPPISSLIAVLEDVCPPGAEGVLA